MRVTSFEVLWRVFCLVVVFCAPAPSAVAQTNPAISVQRNNETGASRATAAAQGKISGPVVISRARSRGPKVAPGGPTVLLKGVDAYPTSAFLTKAQLSAIFAHYIGHRVDFSKIQQLVQDINDLYTKKGIVTANAVLPPQTLTTGVLKVHLVEGRLGKITFSGSHRIPHKFITRRIRTTRAGKVVDVPRAKADITYFNRVYNTQLRLMLRPGAAFGTTDLSFSVITPRKNQGYVFLDNGGVASTGRTELGFYYHGSSLIAPDDSLFAYATAARGSLALTLGYDRPVSLSGTRLGVTYSRSKVNVLNGTASSLNVTGSSQSISFSLSQPFMATTKWLVMGQGALSYGTSASKSSQVYVVQTTTKKLSLGAAVTRIGKWGDVKVVPQVILADSRDDLAGRSTDAVLGLGSINARVGLPRHLSLTAQAGWQIASEKGLPGALQFQLGGLSTVRGYDPNSVYGDGGYYLQMELHKTFAKQIKGLDAYTFIDTGAAAGAGQGWRTMTSVGLGLSYRINKRVTAELSAGFPLDQSQAIKPDKTVYFRITAVAF